MADERPYTTTFQRATRPVRTFQLAVQRAASREERRQSRASFRPAVGAEAVVYEERWEVYERVTAEVERVELNRSERRRRFTRSRRK